MCRWRKQFLADHEDSFLKEKRANQRTLCGHVDVAKEGIPEWEWGAYYPGGAVQGKAMDSDMAAKMSFVARAGHPCGEDFLAKPFLAASSGICVAGSDPEGHEGRTVDSVFRG